MLNTNYARTSGASGNYSANTRGGGLNVGGSPDRHRRPLAAFDHPGYSQTRGPPVSPWPDRPTARQRYIFALEAEPSASSTELLVHPGPLEAYLEPFAASGRFDTSANWPRSGDLRDYGQDGTALTRTRDEDGATVYTVTDGADTFSFRRDDFNLVSFNSNMVLRWEWRPGSTFFFVWQQNRFGSTPDGDLVGPGRFFDSFSAPGTNYLAAKITYWIPVN